MSRLAIFIDGGYLDALTREEYATRVDFAALAEEIRLVIGAKTTDGLDLLRTHYYDCLPYQSRTPTVEEAARFAGKRKFFSALEHIPRFVVREGRLMFRGLDVNGQPIFQQKRVDIQLGLDFALLSGKRQITHAAVLAGDSDFLPAFHTAKEEGILVWLIHGPRYSKKDGNSTYALELWTEADERFELTQDFMNKIARKPKLFP